MRDLLNDDIFMTWALIGSVYLMFFALGWRETSPDRPRRAHRSGNSSLGTVLLAPFFYAICLPSMLSVALLRTLLNRRDR